MNIFLLLFSTIFFHAKLLEAESCLRFCVVHLATDHYTFRNNLLGLNPHFCSHLILNANRADRDYKMDYKLLKNAFTNIDTAKNILPNFKILTYVDYDDLKLNETNNNNNSREIYEKFDGFYFDWRDDFYIGFCGKLETTEKKECFSSVLKNFRQKFKNKIIVTSVGPKNVYREYFDLKVFDENVDFIAMGPDEQLQYVHMQNLFSAKQFFVGNNLKMGNLANVLRKNEISKSKLLIYTFGPDSVVEPRIRVIWSSINNFPGILIDNIEDFNNRLSDANKMNDDITKLVKLHTCPSSDPVKKKIKNLTCYYSLKEEIDFQKISKEIYQNCDRIIFHKLDMNNNDSTEKLKNIIGFFQHLNFTQTSLVLPIDLRYMILQGREYNDNPQGIINFISSNVKGLVDSYNLDGIELICDESMNAENLQNIITNIRTIISKDIEIGLQINVFNKSELFVDVMNSVTWVTHEINPLSDAALAIFYQWNNLYENSDLDLKKVLIKVSPAIWQQNAIVSFDGKYDTKEKEDSEDDVILNRKYLCLNETIYQNLPPPNEYLNLPIVFSIQEKNAEKVKENLLKNLNDPKLMLAVLSLQGFRKPLPRDLYYMRYETKEIIEYKIKIAERFGFGGIAFDSITNDDFEEICGTSLFKELIKIIQ